jgi:hypothetical protein
LWLAGPSIRSTDVACCAGLDVANDDAVRALN